MMNRTDRALIAAQRLAAAGAALAVTMTLLTAMLGLAGRNQGEELLARAAQPARQAASQPRHQPTNPPLGLPYGQPVTLPGTGPVSVPVSVPVSEPVRQPVSQPARQPAPWTPRGMAKA